jgi:xanthine dehydrogenase YagS FAD-binding subunit
MTGPQGSRVIPIAEFHRLPGDTPEIDTNLANDELITAIELPARGFARNYTYIKIRDRLSYAFALVSVAVGLELETSTIKLARIALGGVAHKPWRIEAADALLQGQEPTRAAFAKTADAILETASGFAHNGFKIELARRAIVRALEQAAAGTVQPQSVKTIL